MEKYLGASRREKTFANYFKKDSVVLFPTDTVVGLGCRFDSSVGISRIRSVKGMMDKKALAVLLSNPKQLEILSIRRSRVSNLLMERFWPGGLTIVMTSEKTFPCSGEGDTLGLRMPDVELLRRIIDMVGVPLAATSANFHGQPPPSVLEEVDRSIIKQTDHIIKFDLKPLGLASTVIKVEGGLVKILRQGAISKEEIFDVVGEKS